MLQRRLMHWLEAQPHLYAVVAIIWMYCACASLRAEQLFTTVHYKGDDDKALLSLEIRHAEELEDFPRLLQHKHLLLDHLKLQGQSHEWQAQALAGEIELLETFINLSPDSKEACISALSDQFVLPLYITPTKTTEIKERFERSIDIAENSLGRGSVLMPRYWNILGAVQIGIGDLAGGRVSTLKAIRLSERRIASDNPDTLRAKFQQALILDLEDQANKSHAMQTAAIVEMRQLIANSQDSGIDCGYFATGVDQVYGIQMRKGAVDQAIRTSAFNEECVKGIFGAGSTEYATVLLKTAIAYSAASNPGASIEKATLACDTAQKSQSKDKATIPKILHQAARVFIRAGALKAAADKLEAAQKMYLKAGDVEASIDVMIDRGLVLEDLGQLEEAIKVSTFALNASDAILYEKPELKGEVLECLSRIYQSKKDDLLALRMISSAIEIFETLPTKSLNSSRHLSRARIRRGDLYVRMEKLDLAITEFAAAYKLRLQSLGENHPDTKEAKAKLVTIGGG